MSLRLAAVLRPGHPKPPKHDTFQASPNPSVSSTLLQPCRHTGGCPESSSQTRTSSAVPRLRALRWDSRTEPTVPQAADRVTQTASGFLQCWVLSAAGPGQFPSYCALDESNARWWIYSSPIHLASEDEHWENPNNTHVTYPLSVSHLTFSRAKTHSLLSTFQTNSVHAGVNGDSRDRRGGTWRQIAEEHEQQLTERAAETQRTRDSGARPLMTTGDVRRCSKCWGAFWKLALRQIRSCQKRFPQSDRQRKPLSWWRWRQNTEKWQMATREVARGRES